MNQAPWVEREIRVPLYVPVQTEPRLHSCWAVNLSLSGIGLVAARASDGAPPTEGMVLTLRFALPGEPSVSLSGEVQWCYDTSGTMDGQSNVAVGVRFIEVAGPARLALTRYFHAYRPRVVVVGADSRERAQMEAALSTHVHCLFVADYELTDVLGRGDISAVVVCGEDAGVASALVDRMSAGGANAEVGVTPASDLAPRLVYAAAADAARLVDAFNLGKLFAVVARPVDGHELQAAVLRACADYGVRTEQHRVALALERALARERARSRPTVRLESIARSHLVVESREMTDVLETVRRVAPHKVAVLLEGETGTGKELLARLLHELSDRANAAYVAQDCGALTETLLESELFGHVKGAFTGAVASHPGLFVMAEGGTIFLDEIENTSANLQAKLLRVIETGEVRPVGGTKVRQVDVRLVAASNRDLAQAMREGRFRADLYFRLTTFPVRVPPLRERVDDILPLARHFLREASVAFGHDTDGITKDGERALLAYDWPGNVRELRNAMERAALLVEAGPLDIHALPAVVQRGPAPGPDGDDDRGSLRERLEHAERDIIRAALEKNGGVIRRAAFELDANPVTLARRARRLGLVR